MSLHALETALNALRANWPHDWPGLPAVMQGCVHQLGGAQADSHSARVLMVAQELAKELERHGQALGADEPPYHSRLHLADTLVALSALLVALRVQEHRTDQPIGAQEALMLLAMLGHDAWHPGRSNLVTSELELASAQRVVAVMARHGLSEADCDEVSALILATALDRDDDKLQADAQAFSLASLASRATLVREADVLVSALPAFGASLTQALSREWARLDARVGDALLQPEARQRFLRTVARFSSPPARALGLPQIVRMQLA